MKLVGIEYLVATNAAGGINKTFQVNAAYLQNFAANIRADKTVEYNRNP